MLVQEPGASGRHGDLVVKRGWHQVAKGLYSAAHARPRPPDSGTLLVVRTRAKATFRRLPEGSRTLLALRVFNTQVATVAPSFLPTFLF